MNLRVGCELEVPLSQEGGYKRKCGKNSHSIVNSAYLGGSEAANIGREMKSDGTVGLEITSNILNTEEIKKWYRYVWGNVFHVTRRRIEPTGRLELGGTAGLHQHLSPVDTDVARELYDFSLGNLARLCFCTSFVLKDLTDGKELEVFRGPGYCYMGFDRDYDVVHRSYRHNGNYQGEEDHWEWRLPEPMEPDNYDVMMDFLKLWYARSLSEAQTWLRKVVQGQPQVFTSLNRLASLAAWKAVNVSRSSLVDALQAKFHRSGELFPTDFGHSVREDREAPIIYLVKMGKKAYYLLISKKDRVVEWEGNVIGSGSVLKVTRTGEEGVDAKSAEAGRVRLAWVLTRLKGQYRDVLREVFNV